MLSDEIGHMAGKVWRTLHEQGEMTVAGLKKAVGAKDSSVDWAIGWLAREGKLAFRKDRNLMKVALKR